MHIAITTPTGNIGRALTAILQSETDHSLTLLARDASKLTAESEQGAVVKEGDMADAAFVTEATKGADALFFLIPPNFAAADYRAFQNVVTAAGVEAVRTNGIGRVILLSSVGAQHGEGTGPVAGLHDAEAAFQSTPAHVTALRPGWFMENYLPHLETIRSDGHIYMPLSPTARASMIATSDIARAGAEALATEGQGFEIAELLGPRELSLEEAAGTIGKALGRPVQHIEVAPEQAREAFLGMGLGENMTGLYLEMFDGFEKGLIAPEFPRTEASTTPTDLEDFTKSTLGPALQ